MLPRDGPPMELKRPQLFVRISSNSLGLFAVAMLVMVTAFNSRESTSIGAIGALWVDRSDLLHVEDIHDVMTAFIWWQSQLQNPNKFVSSYRPHRNVQQIITAITRYFNHPCISMKNLSSNYPLKLLWSIFFLGSVTRLDFTRAYFQQLMILVRPRWRPDWNFWRPVLAWVAKLAAKLSLECPMG